MTTLWVFTGRHDGKYPLAGPTLTSDGSLIGSASQSGGSGKAGTFYKFTSGVLVPLYSFDKGAPNPYGIYPEDKLTVVNGNVIGATAQKGDDCKVPGGPRTPLGCGAIVSVAP